MLSKTQNKYIRSLSQQKYRKENGSYVVEGDKIAKEWLLFGSNIQKVVALEGWASEHKALIDRHKEVELIITDEEGLKSVSSLQAPNKVLLIVGFDEDKPVLPEAGWCVALSQLQDPGNMGTIIRIADWFGISHVVSSPDSVDYYNPKVIQAAMGGHLRVQLHTTDLADFFEQSKLPVIAATLDGANIYEADKIEEGIILLGNESKGLPQELINKAKYNVMIPKKGGAESLNVAVSAGILCALLAGR